MLYDFKVFLEDPPEARKIGHQSPLYFKQEETELDKQLTVVIIFTHFR